MHHMILPYDTAYEGRELWLCVPAVLMAPRWPLTQMLRRCGGGGIELGNPAPAACCGHRQRTAGTWGCNSLRHLVEASPNFLCTLPGLSSPQHRPAAQPPAEPPPVAHPGGLPALEGAWLTYSQKCVVSSSERNLQCSPIFCTCHPPRQLHPRFVVGTGADKPCGASGSRPPPRTCNNY